MTPGGMLFIGTIVAMGIMGLWIGSWVNDLFPMDPKDPKKKGDK